MKQILTRPATEWEEAMWINGYLSSGETFRYEETEEGLVVHYTVGSDD